jgi:hypothetical protein
MYAHEAPHRRLEARPGNDNGPPVGGPKRAAQALDNYDEM